MLTVPRAIRRRRLVKNWCPWNGGSGAIEDVEKTVEGGQIVLNLKIFHISTIAFVGKSVKSDCFIGMFYIGVGCWLRWGGVIESVSIDQIVVLYHKDL